MKKVVQQTATWDEAEAKKILDTIQPYLAK
jgi:hypothetical protein